MTDRVIGKHAGCGGEIVYRSPTPAAGIRYCRKCGQSSHKPMPGARRCVAPETEEEVERRRAQVERDTNEHRSRLP